MEFFILLMGLVLVGVVVFLVHYFSEAERIKRTMKAAPRVDIRDAAAGAVVRVVGRVTPIGPLLTSPFTRRPCVYYAATVEQYRSSGKSGRWVQIVLEYDGVDFLLEDGTGRALVHASGMRTVPVRDAERRSGFLNDASPDLEAFLAKHGKSSTGLVFNKNLRYREALFEPNETVAVVGQVSWERDPDPTEAGAGYRDGPKRAVISAPPGLSVLASDDVSTH